MKKILSWLLILVLLIISLASCSQNLSEGSSNNKSGNKTLNVNEYVCETPTRILYSLDDTLYYYNKLDGGSYVFCFNPVCKHKNDCISKKLRFGIWQGITYREEDNRLYALRGNNFLSMNFDGSDIKFLYSFGENNWNDNQYETIVLQYLQLVGEYAYMLVQNEDTANMELHRYHIDEGILENLMMNTSQIVSIERYTTNGEEIYFWSYSAEQHGFYKSNMDLTNVQKLSEGDDGYYSPDSVFDGETFYIPVYEKINDKTFTKEFRTYNVKEQRETLLCKLDVEGYAYIYSITDHYLYYSVNNPIIIGQKKTGLGNVYDQKNYHSSVQRLDMETGEIQTVFYNLNYEILGMCLIDNSVMLRGHIFEKSGDYIISDSYMMIANIDENGNFVNIRVLEE